MTVEARLPARWRAIALVALATLVLDQLTKWWAVNALADGHTVDVVWTLRFALHYNTGAAFSLGQDSGVTRFLPLVVLVVVAAVVWRGRAQLSRVGALAVGLIVGGAVGNIVDRVARAQDGILSGAVIDFIDLQWYPVFNVADMGVVVGGILFAIVSMAAPTDEGDGTDGVGGAGRTGTIDPGVAEGPAPGDGSSTRLADADRPG